MNTTNFLYYDHDQQTWQPTTLEALATLNDPELHIIPIDENNRHERQTTWGHYSTAACIQARTNKPKPKTDHLLQYQQQQRHLKESQSQEQAEKEQSKYHYEIIEHTKYKGLTGNDYDTKGLQEKINNLAQKGYRLVGVCSPTTMQNQTTNSLFGGGSSIALHGVIAIMEKEL